MHDLSPPPSRPATANTSWWWALLVWCLCAGLTVAAAVLLSGWNRAGSPMGGVPSFDALAPVARRGLLLTALGGWVGGTWWIARRTGRTRVAVVVSVVLLGATWMGSSIALFWRGRWIEHCRITDAKGRTYLVLQGTPSFIDRHIALGHVREPGWIVESIDILQEGEHGAGDAGWLVLPDGFDRPDGFFFVRRDDGGVVAVEHDEQWSTGAVFARTVEGEETVADPYVLFVDHPQRPTRESTE